MNMALSILLLAAGPSDGGEKAGPAPRIVLQDLQQVSKVSTPEGETFTATRTLSLRAGKNFAEGTVWLLCSKTGVMYRGSSQADDYGAFRGTYQFLRGGDA